MNIKIKCNHCGKGYQVDVALAGKKARCKKCGQQFLVQMIDEESEAGGGDLMAGLASAAESERKATVAAPARTTGQGEEHGCPSCGTAMAAEAVICINCGYNRRSGGRMRTVTEREAVRETPRVSAGDGGGRERRDSSGVRLNEPYRNGFLNLLDQVVPEICTWLFGLGILLQLIPILSVARVSAGAMIGLLFGFCVVWALFFCAFLPVVLYGLAAAGKVAKFEVPENPFKRLLAVYFGSLLTILIIVFVGWLGVAGHAKEAEHSQKALATLTMAVQAVAVIALLCYAPVNFLLFKFFFRLKWVEAIIGWLFLILFTILGTVVFYAVLLLLGMMLAAVAGGGAGG